MLPLILIVTSLGTMKVQLDPVHAPITTANFLKYVDNGTYAHATFYRTAHNIPPYYDPPKTGPLRTIDIIQGGLDPAKDDDGLRPIPLERTAKTGLHNVAGTIGMARAKAADTATTEFTIHLGDDRVLDSDRRPDHNGYAVFGRVVSGLDVARRIQQQPHKGQLLTPPIRIIAIKRAA
jgi:peptidyl-prolyl cis-trans isomerase A (cyclophilin A)